MVGEDGENDGRRCDGVDESEIETGLCSLPSATVLFTTGRLGLANMVDIDNDGGLTGAFPGMVDEGGAMDLAVGGGTNKALGDESRRAIGAGAEAFFSGGATMTGSALMVGSVFLRTVGLGVWGLSDRIGPSSTETTGEDALEPELDPDADPDSESESASASRDFPGQ